MEKIAVIGIGKLGLCLALQLDLAGYEVLGIDVNDDYIQAINQRSWRSSEPGVEEALHAANSFLAGRIENLKTFDAGLILVAVATPAIDTGGYDHSIADAVLRSLYESGPATRRKDIVICCTTLPGYSDAKAAEATKYNYFISYKPEFIAQGSIMHDLHYPDQVLIGEADEFAGNKLEMVYSAMHKNKPVVSRMNRLSAEITKLATNCFLTMKITFANSVGDLSERVGAETEKILSAIGSDSRIGDKFLRYGFGYGGPCFPRDNRALEYFAGMNGQALLLSKATDEANRLHLEFQFEQHLHSNPNGEPIHFYSLTYKPGTSILEESQQLALALKLAKAGKTIVIHESEEVISQVKAMHGNLFEYVQNV